MAKRYQLIDHTADTGIRVFGKDPAELFSRAGEALFDIIFGLENISGAQKGGRVEVGGEDFPDLMVGWLGKLLLKFELDDFLSSRFDIIHLDEKHLSADVFGERFNPRAHKALAEVKGVTYHGLKVGQKDGLWTAEVIFDV